MTVPQYTRKIRGFSRRLRLTEADLSKYFRRGLRHKYPALFTRLTVDYAGASMEELARQAQLVIEAECCSAKPRDKRHLAPPARDSPAMRSDPTFEQHLKTLVAAIHEQDQAKGRDPGYLYSQDSRQDQVALDHNNASDSTETETASEDDLSE